MAGTDLRTPLEAVLADAFETGLVADAVLAESEAQAATLWRICHSVSEGSKRAGYVVSHDSAVPVEQQAAFARNVERRIPEAVPEARVVMHGHIGDGNIHVLAILDRTRYPDAAAAAPLAQRINEVVDDETAALGGVISAEHGIGRSNRGRLARVADPVDLALMRRVKALRGLTAPKLLRSVRISSGNRPPHSQPRSRKGSRSVPGGATQPAAP